MTEAEWAEIADRMVARWPQVDWAGLLEQGTLARWYLDLSDLPGEQVAVVCELLYREGREWPAHAGTIRDRLLELTVDAPSWSDVKVAITGVRSPDERRQADYCPDESCDGSTWILGDDNETRPCTCRQARIDGGRPKHPLIAAFVDEVGRSEVSTIDGDRTAEAQVRTKWETFVARALAAERAADLPDAGLPALERAAKQRVLGVAIDDQEPKQIGPAILEALRGGQGANAA